VQVSGHLSNQIRDRLAHRRKHLHLLVLHVDPVAARTERAWRARPRLGGGGGQAVEARFGQVAGGVALNMGWSRYAVALRRSGTEG
jgi:hypothetical protein